MKNPDKSYYYCDNIGGRLKGHCFKNPIHSWKYKAFFKHCKIKQNSSLLDIGCNDGGFLSLARNKGFIVYGIDIDEIAVLKAKKNRGLDNVISGSWEIISEKNGWNNFNVITLFDMLEHESSPLSLIDTTYKFLKDGGVIFITVPRYDRYPKIFDKDADYPPHHFTLWTPIALEKLLLKCNYKEISIIDKPLMAEDILNHILWRIKRFMNRFSIKNNLNSYSEKSESIENVMPTRDNILYKTSHKIILCILILFSGFLIVPLKLLKIAKGHTLIAIGKKLS